MRSKAPDIASNFIANEIGKTIENFDFFTSFSLDDSKNESFLLFTIIMI